MTMQATTLTEATPRLTGFLSFRDRYRILHLSWAAFFANFLVWFNHAPAMAAIRETFGLDQSQVTALLVLNVALAIPGRIAAGMLVDRFGPRISFSAILVVSGLICIAFALSTTFEALAITRFLLGIAGAGFVVGIRMISEWFPAKQMGLAQGIYAGLGNFGSAAAAFALPALIALFAGFGSWRTAIAITGAVSVVYGFLYYALVTDTPKGMTYFKPKKSGGMEVSTRGDMALCIAMQAPIHFALGLLSWQLGFGKLRLLPDAAVWCIWGVLAALYAQQIAAIVRVNAEVLRAPAPAADRYRFAQVAVLCLMYLVSFGGELAVASMLPLYFKDTYGLTLQQAGLAGGCFAGMAFVMRPFGGWLSDRIGRKVSLVVVLAGMIVGYAGMAGMTAEHGLAFAVPVMIATAVFVNAANGTVYAVLPIIKRRLTGQIAGLAGAYGNVGSVLFLLVLGVSSPSILFLCIAGASVAALACVLAFFREPEGAITEVLPDGTVTMIEVK